VTTYKLNSEIESLNSRIALLEMTVANLNETLFNMLANSADDELFRDRVVAAVKKAETLRHI
jgi:hypothetical protein